jgi:S1-C subfamily serine protease
LTPTLRPPLITLALLAGRAAALAGAVGLATATLAHDLRLLTAQTALSPDAPPAAGEALGLQILPAPPWTVTAVQGPAARAGLHVGDHVLAVNGQPFARVEQLPASLSRDNPSAALLVERDGREIFIPLHWP